MKMVRYVTGCFVALSLALMSVSAVRRILNSIEDLRSCHNAPANHLELLHWFANVVRIDGNVIRFTFDPHCDFGSHHYGNHDGLLERQHWGNYYTIGNIIQPGSASLPSYVVRRQSGSSGWNRARIIIRAWREKGGSNAAWIADRVYITQHYGMSNQHYTPYDPDNTYEVTTNFLRQLRQYSISEIQQRSGSSQFGYGLQSSYSPSYFNQSAQRPPNQECSLGCICMFFMIAFILIIIFSLSSLGNIKKY